MKLNKKQNIRLESKIKIVLEVMNCMPGGAASAVQNHNVEEGRRTHIEEGNEVEYDPNSQHNSYDPHEGNSNDDDNYDDSHENLTPPADSWGKSAHNNINYRIKLLENRMNLNSRNFIPVQLLKQPNQYQINEYK